MKYAIDPEVLEKFPSTILGLVFAKGIDNTGSPEEISKLVKDQEIEIKNNFTSETLSKNPKIALWRIAFSQFGAKPKKYKASIENLCRMILGGTSLKHINKVVDIYNYISIKNLASLGGDDFDKIQGDVVLKLANGDEKFYELNTGELKHPKKGEVIYTDDVHVMCRRWNWRQGDGTKIEEDTKNVVLIVEALDPFTRTEIQAIIGDLAGLITQHCGGEAKTFILDKDNPEAEFGF